MNNQVVAQSLIAIACVVLAYAVNFWFLLPAIVLMFLNQRALFPKKK